MANEITTQVALYATKNNATIDTRINGAIPAVSLSLAGTNMLGGETMTVATGAWNAVSFGNISGAPGMWWVKNCDATNYVQFSLNNSGTQIFCTLQAGQTNLISLASGTIYAEAHTSSVQIQYFATEA